MRTWQRAAIIVVIVAAGAVPIVSGIMKTDWSRTTTGTATRAPVPERLSDDGLKHQVEQLAQWGGLRIFKTSVVSGEQGRTLLLVFQSPGTEDHAATLGTALAVARTIARHYGIGLDYVVMIPSDDGESGLAMMGASTDLLLRMDASSAGVRSFLARPECIRLRASYMPTEKIGS